jgi:hypothetical protein
MAAIGRCRVLFRNICLLAYVHLAVAQTGYVYQLDTEYAGANFFQGWDFFTVSTPKRCPGKDTEYATRVVIRPEAMSHTTVNRLRSKRVSSIQVPPRRLISESIIRRSQISTGLAGPV